MPQVDYLLQVHFVTRGDKPEEAWAHSQTFLPAVLMISMMKRKCLLALLLPSLTQLALQVPLGTANLKGTAQNILRGMFLQYTLCSSALASSACPMGLPATHTHKKADTIESHTLRLSQTEVDHHSRLKPFEVGVLPLHTAC